VTRKEIMMIGSSELGDIAFEKIRAYYHVRDQRSISDIFYILYEISKRILYSDFNGIQKHVLDETAYQISEDILLSIHRVPGKHITHSNFFGYVRSAVKNKARNTVLYLNHLTSTFESLDDESSLGKHQLDEMCQLPSVEENIILRDDILSLIDAVTEILKYHPRYSENYSFLIWPVIYSVLHDNDEVFSTMPFRDRCAFRIIRCQVAQIFTERLKNLYEQ
jgi:hypothetical protein